MLTYIDDYRMKSAGSSQSLTMALTLCTCVGFYLKR